VTYTILTALPQRRDEIAVRRPEDERRLGTAPEQSSPLRKDRRDFSCKAPSVLRAHPKCDERSNICDDGISDLRHELRQVLKITNRSCHIAVRIKSANPAPATTSCSTTSLSK
jgi:hypothetical protein